MILGEGIGKIHAKLSHLLKSSENHGKIVLQNAACLLKKNVREGWSLKAGHVAYQSFTLRWVGFKSYSRVDM